MITSIRAIMSDYVRVRGGNTPVGKEHPIRDRFRQLCREINSSAPLATRPGLTFRYIIGGPNLALHPYIWLKDSREEFADTIDLDIRFILHREMSRLYLALGCSDYRDRYEDDADAYLKARTKEVAPIIDRLTDRGFGHQSRLPLGCRPSDGCEAEDGYFSHRRYQREQLPTYDTLVADLEAILGADVWGIDHGLGGPGPEAQQVPRHDF